MQLGGGAVSLPDCGKASTGTKPLLGKSLSSAQGTSAEAHALQLTAPQQLASRALYALSHTNTNKGGKL